MHQSRGTRRRSGTAQCYGKFAFTVGGMTSFALTTHVGLDPVQAPDQKKPGGSAPADDVAVNVTDVGFTL